MGRYEMRPRSFAGIGALVLAACGGHQQSALDAAGPQAGQIESLWWFFLWLLGAIFVIVVADRC